MINDLINFIKSKFRGDKTSPLNLNIDKKTKKQKRINNDISENEHDESEDKKNISGRLGIGSGVTIVSILVTCFVLLWWISTIIAYQIAPTVCVTAYIDSFSSDPYGINLIYDMQKRSVASIGSINVGDELDISSNGEYCSKENPCYKMIVSEINNNNAFLQFKEKLFPSFISMNDYNKYIKKTNSPNGNRLELSGKIVDNKFFIEYIKIINK